MFPYNEYTVRERGKELMRTAAQVRLGREYNTGSRVGERVGRTLMALGARMAAQDECQRVETRGGQVVTACPA